MRTRWGSCNIGARRIWLNLELGWLDPKYLEYVVVHEMTHLLERRHNRRFYALLETFMPEWRSLRHSLNAIGIGSP
jgi:predicted metal-dependent hydrolase